MNGEVQNFIGHCVESYPLAGRILEIGSKDICGSPRHWFTDSKFTEYIGIDWSDGNGVDKVMSGHDIARHLGRHTFDIVISTSAMEHDPEFWITVEQIQLVLRFGGWFILTVPSWRGEVPHDLHDYYRFMPEGIEYLMQSNCFDIIELIDHVPSNDVMCLARKPQ